MAFESTTSAASCATAPPGSNDGARSARGREAYSRTASHADAASGDGAGKPGIASLLKELRDETTTLLRQEVLLAKTEMSDKAAKAGRNVSYIAAGGVVLLAALLCFLAAAAHGLAVLFVRGGLEPENAIWLSWLIVGGAVAVVGGVLLSKGISALSNMTPVPHESMQSLKEDKQWLTNKIS